MIWFSMFIPLGPRPQRRYSPYVRYSPYRKLSRDFPFGSSGSGDLESAQSTITSGTSCGLPSPVDNVSLDCSIQASIISEVSELELEAGPAVRVNLKEPEDDDQEKEMTFPGAYLIQASIISEVSELELEARPAVRVNLNEPEEDDQEKEMSFPGAYPIEQVVYSLDEPAKLRARHFVKVAQKNHFNSEVLPCPTTHPSAQHGFKELFFRVFAYFFDW
jgi:hypothetical protein